MQGRDWQPGDDEPVLDVLNRILDGKGTAEDRERIMRELQAPNSPLHDYLEQFAEWAQQAFDRPDPNAAAGEQMLSAAASRDDRSRIVRFVTAKKSAGIINAEKASAILAAGRVDESESNESVEVELRSANDAMIAAIVRECPELSREAEALRESGSERGGPEGGRRP